MLRQLQAVFKSFGDREVRYIVIGGIAAVLRGVPRATFDLDVLIEATPENAQRLLDALLDAQMGTAALTTAEGVLANEITVFDDRVRVDVQTSTPGIDFAGAWSRRETMTYGGQPFYVVSLPDLIASKLAAGRPRDLEDVRLLQVGKDELSG
jgi:predicted nucleotidyltransferase